MKKIKQIAVALLEKHAPYTALALRANSQLYTGESELSCLKQIVPSDKVAVDVGANRGVYSYWLAKLAKKTIVFEPHPRMVDYLRRSLGDKVEIIPSAVSDSSGVIDLCVPSTAGSEQTYRGSIQESTADGFTDTVSYTVDMVTLDDRLTDRPVGFIKIDVEGHELSVLVGCKQVLMKDRPVLLVESEERHQGGTIQSIQSFLSALEYAGYFYNAKKWTPISEFSVEIHQSSEAELNNTYINNFLFVHNDTEIKGLWSR